jgi:hypothetical protein
MRTEFLTLVFIVGVTATAQARLGETPDQLVARYGQPLSEVDQKPENGKVAIANVVFQKGGFEIDVAVNDGFSVQETFKKLNGQPLSLGEVQTLLNDNGLGNSWEPPVYIQQGKMWKRDDGAVGIVGADGALTLKTKELIAKESTARKDERAPTLEGF